MEWLVLVVLVPAILVPVVLLWGFAGCSFTAPLSSDAQRPTNLRAKGISVSAISLTWDNPNTDPVTFQVERTKEGESVPQILASTSTVFNDTGLQEATSYFYRVRAIRLSDNDESDLSDQAPARTLGLVFQSALTTDQTGLEGFCLVQRIEPSRLRLSTLAGGIATLGARVRITLRGSAATNLILNRVFISQPASAGDLYDSGGDLTHVASNAVVDANVSVPMPDIDYDLDHTKPLLIAFDISSAPGSGSVRFLADVPESEAIMHFNPATAEAGVNDRLPSVSNPGAPAYTPSKSIYLVEKIEVV